MSKKQQRRKRPIHQLLDNMGPVIRKSLETGQRPFNSSFGPTVVDNEVMVMREMFSAYKDPVFIVDGIENYADQIKVHRQHTETFDKHVQDPNTRPSMPVFDNCAMEWIIGDPDRMDIIDTDGEPYLRWIIFVRRLPKLEAKLEAQTKERRWSSRTGQRGTRTWGYGVIAMSKNGLACGLPARIDFDEHGIPIGDQCLRDAQVYNQIAKEAGINAANALDLVGGKGVAMACLTFSMLHAKNIETAARPATKQEHKLCKKRGRKPITTYKTLVVKPMGKKDRMPLTMDSTLHSEEGQTPYHLCRGHFRTYGEQNKLFGRYTGSFWIPAHARGKKEHGQVVKDYEIQSI